MSKQTKIAEKQPSAQPKQAGGPGFAERMGRLKEFFEESKGELKKVTWPTRKETVATSTAVLVLVILMSLFLGVIDIVLSKLMTFILS